MKFLPCSLLFLTGVISGSLTRSVLTRQARHHSTRCGTRHSRKALADDNFLKTTPLQTQLAAAAEFSAELLCAEYQVNNRLLSCYSLDSKEM